MIFITNSFDFFEWLAMAHYYRKLLVKGSFSSSADG